MTDALPSGRYCAPSTDEDRAALINKLLQSAQLAIADARTSGLTVHLRHTEGPANVPQFNVTIWRAL